MTRTVIDATTLLLAGLDEAFDRKSWHGTNLRGSIRGLTAAQAAWRPARGRHNIQEIVIHCAYWKYVAWRRLLGGKRGEFPRAGSDWFLVARADASAWAEDIRLLGEMHRQLRATVASMPPQRLDKPIPGGKLQAAALIRGAAAHDLYHAGQIQLIKRFIRSRVSR